MSTPIETTTPTTDPAPAVESPGATPETDPLGAPGLAALAAERKAKAAAEKRAADAEARVKAFEDAQKTEAEKQASRLAEIERENADLKIAKTRAEVAEAKSDPTKGILIPASLLTGSTREEIEASADALIAFKGTAPQGGRLVVPDEGGAPNLALNGDGIESALKKALGIQ